MQAKDSEFCGEIIQKWYKLPEHLWETNGSSRWKWIFQEWALMLCRGEHQFGSTQHFPGTRSRVCRDSVTQVMKVFVEQNLKCRFYWGKGIIHWWAHLHSNIREDSFYFSFLESYEWDITTEIIKIIWVFPDPSHVSKLWGRCPTKLDARSR